MLDFMRKISLEGRILLSVCLADCFLSLYFVQAKLAIEANPLMRFLFETGAGYFAIFKICWSVLFIYFLEVLGKQEPEFAGKAMRLAIVLYLAIIALPNLLVWIGKI